ncbi:SDR family oxidoreductase [Microbaculum marinum]|uniref:SDR family oxidoreductase n=1 Tax=Microbaculum marinum TaxID=1764581 RepID=A0AAW9RDL6_9HYPH
MTGDTPLSRYSLDGRTALVTGAGRGIGRACALALARSGADVALMSRSRDELESLASEVKATGRRAHVLVADVCDKAAVDAAISGLPRLDVLVNNAGTNVPQEFLDVDEETFDRVTSINIRAAFFTAQAAARRMVAAGAGAIVNMSSQAGHVALVRRTVYCTTKFAIEGLTKAMAVDLRGTGVRVNAVAPTFVETPMTKPFLSDPDFRAYVDANLLTTRLAGVDDVADAVLFLSCDASGMVTGTSLLVDGGWTAH